METKEKAKGEPAKEVRDSKAAKQEKSTATKAASRFKRKPLL
ncbi:hypothetical protein [Mucilaginibacter sp. SP1R1]|nr:hypothetical protein [Mucilaginibacter sp. SP1R1]MBB6150614.1 hypothetical protein [Mucilaginibacter sp. SP1R1]